MRERVRVRSYDVHTYTHTRKHQCIYILKHVYCVCAFVYKYLCVPLCALCVCCVSWESLYMNACEYLWVSVYVCVYVLCMYVFVCMCVGVRMCLCLFYVCEFVSEYV